MASVGSPALGSTRKVISVTRGSEAGTAVGTTSITTIPSSVLGVYAGAGDPSAAASFGTWLGHPVRYAMDFFDGSSWSTISKPTWIVDRWAGTSYRMIWGVPILPNSGASLAAGATGAYDQYFQQLATFLVAHGQGSSILRLGWEFNGSWFPWSASADPQAFIEYWRQIVTTMRAVPGANFSFEWNPTRGAMSLAPPLAWPGSAYVNIVGMDVYDLQWPAMPNAEQRWNYFLTEPYGLNWLANFAALHGKPIAFPEWGLVRTGSQGHGGGDDPVFISGMASFIASHDVVNAVFWNYGSSAVTAGAYPDAGAALREAFAAPAVSQGTSLAFSSSRSPSSVSSVSAGSSPSQHPQPAGYPATPGSQGYCGQVPPVSEGGWHLNGSARVSEGWLVLTSVLQGLRGSAIWPTPVSTAKLSVSFTASLGGGTGGNGLTFMLLDPSATASALGENGGGEGFAGLPGEAVSLTTYTNGKVNEVGIADGQGSKWSTLHEVAATGAVPDLRNAPVTVNVAVGGGAIEVSVDGSPVLRAPASLPPAALIGFSAANGYFTDSHVVTSMRIQAC